MQNKPTDDEIKMYLQEDLGTGDVTAEIIPQNCLANARVICREACVVCGQAWFDAVFNKLSDDVEIHWQIAEGELVSADTELCTLNGPARALLSGERTALNLLQTLSATATVSRRYADAVAGTGCKLLDTRKTLPGLRMAQKYAVRCGGCFNHRIGLFDAVLIKENHILAAGSIQQAIHTARQQSALMVEVEVESLSELKQALEAKPDRVLLDNFTIDELLQAVKMTKGCGVELEASGNIELPKIRDVAQTGIDFISIGALTKHVQAIDLSMRIDLEKA